jgi:flagellar basal body-associated protein FliL
MSVAMRKRLRAPRGGGRNQKRHLSVVRTGIDRRRGVFVSILWIILIIVIVLALLGFLGRGAW